MFRALPGLVLALTIALPAVAQETASDSLLTVGHYLDYETVADPRLSPDGRQVIYTRRWVNRLEDKWESALWMMHSDGSRNRFLTKGEGAVWSPDGTRIAYLAEGEPKGTQIFVRWMDAEGAVSQVTRLTQSPADVKWSPDGKSLGFTMFKEKAPVWKIDLPAAPEGAKWTKAPRYVDRLHYRQDRRGFTESGFTHLFVVSADGGTPRQITSGEWSVGARFDGLTQSVEWNWTPDGRKIVVDGLKVPDADLRYRDSEIYLVDVETGSITSLTSAPGTWTGPVVSPDGKSVAYSGYPQTKQTYQARTIRVSNLDGSDVRVLAPALDRDPDRLHWAPDGTGLYFTANDRGSSNLQFAGLDGTVRQVTTGTHMLSLGSVGRGAAVGVASGPQAPPDVVRIDVPLKRPATILPLTRVNEDLLASKRLATVEEIWYSSTNDVKVQGWLVKPPGFDPKKTYPLIMEIHGGPHAMYNVGFNWMFQNFAANGYLVLYTNPRGSTGYGTAFGAAISQKYPGPDYDDLMAAVDTVVGRGYVDASRMYVGGCSGGGVLSSWVIGHTNRFAAAAVRCPVINWISMAGQSDIPYFTHNWFHKPFWEDPAPWLEQSPLMHVGKVQTPTLVMTGELDLRTPMPQSEEYFAALKMRGVPSALLRFEGEFHGTSSKPSNFMRTQLYMMSWYQRYPAKQAETAVK